MRCKLLGVLALAIACTPKGGRNGHADPGDSVTAIVNATVIPMDTERLIADAVVVVRGDQTVVLKGYGRRSTGARNEATTSAAVTTPHAAAPARAAREVPRPSSSAIQRATRIASAGASGSM